MKRVLAMLMVVAALPLAAQSVIPAGGERGTFAITGATIHPVTSPSIERGTIVISNGTIAALGASVAIPAGAVVIDATGLHVYPGMIDASTNVGLTEISSVRGSVDTAEVGSFNPNARTKVAINPHSELIPVTRVGGVTTVVAVPEGGVISGQDALINLAGWTPEEMVVKAPVALHVRLPRLRSGGSDPEALKKAKEGYEKQLEELRTFFRDAKAYAKARAATGAPRVDRDLRFESMIDVVEGRVPVVFHAEYARDLKQAIEFAEEVGVRPILSGAAHVQLVLDLVKEKNVPVLLGPILALPPLEDDPYDLIYSNAAALHRAGIPFAIQTADAHNSRNLPMHAGMSAAFGLPKEEALKAVTLYPAQILGVADLLGSLEPGKIANVIVTDGDPLEVRTGIHHVFVAGQRVPMDSRHTLLWEKQLKRH